MTLIPLANLLQDNDALREVAKHWNRTGTGSPVILVLLLGVAVMLATAYYVWRWQMRRLRQPNSRALLKLAADRLGLSAVHRNLLWQIGRSAGLEPAVALVSPQLLVQMVHAGEQHGLDLTGRQMLQIGAILDTVSAATVQADR